MNFKQYATCMTCMRASGRLVIMASRSLMTTSG